MKRPITAEDIEKDPSLVDQGYNVGDEYDFPEEQVSSEEKDNEETTASDESGQEGDDGGNGGNHPPGGPGKP